MLAMIASGIEVEVHHHEVGTAGQTEIDMRYNTLTRMADQVMMYKYIVKNVCAANGYTATSCRSRCSATTALGCTCTLSLWNGTNNLFFDKNGYALISDSARWYIGGLIKHAAALLAFAAPTTNSYRRLVPGYEAPINLIYSQRNRSAICRIPMYSTSPKAKRLEFRAPDPSANPYLTFAALLMAGLDGIKNKIEPPKRWTWTCTNWSRKSGSTSRTRREVSSSRCRPWRPTMRSCSKAASSRRPHRHLAQNEASQGCGRRCVAPAPL